MLHKKEIMPPEHCATVKEYEKSAWWRKKREAILDDKDCICDICGRRRWVWQPKKKAWKRSLRFAVHHITYENCPNEKREDFMVLCNLCHTTGHEGLRHKNIHTMYTRIADIISQYFSYKGIDTFHNW